MTLPGSGVFRYVVVSSLASGLAGCQTNMDHDRSLLPAGFYSSRQYDVLAFNKILPVLAVARILRGARHGASFHPSSRSPVTVVPQTSWICGCSGHVGSEHWRSVYIDTL